MPIELFLSPFMRPVVKAESAVKTFQRTANLFTPTHVPLSENASPYSIRREFGSGSKVFDVFSTCYNDGAMYGDRIFHLKRSRAVKGAYKLFRTDDENPIATLRAGPRSNFLIMGGIAGSELELGWHVVNFRADAVDSYRIFQLSDGHSYQWSNKGHFLEKILNLGQQEAEVRERVAHVQPLSGGQGMDLKIDESKVDREVAIITAFICYIEMWNTLAGYGGIYHPDRRSRILPWKE